MSALDLEEISPVAFGVALVTLAEHQPNHALIVAARIAVEQIDLRCDRRAALREVSRDICAAADWRRIANQHVTHEELQRRRAQPGPLAAERRTA
jgi:hypothetical protein